MNNSFKFADSNSHRQTTLQNKNDVSRKDDRPLRGTLQITKNNQVTNNNNDNSNLEIEKKEFYEVHISSAGVKNKKEECKLNDKSLIFAQESKFYIEINRLLYSNNCVGIYIFLLAVCVVLLIYSFVAFFGGYSDLPIIVAEIILTIIITVDMSIRIYVAGCVAYFTKLINIFDIILLALSCFSIILYLVVRNNAEKLETMGFALLILVRNLIQLLRLFVLLKNQSEVRKNVEQFIHFSSFFEDGKRVEKAEPGHKYNKNLNMQALSFVDEEMNKKNEIKNSVENLDYKETENTKKSPENKIKVPDL